MRQNLINRGDMGDLYRKVRQRGLSFLFSKLHLNPDKRIWQTWNHIQHESNWWEVPGVRARWNELSTGQVDLHYSAFFAQQFLTARSDLRMLSVGCGTGSPELQFAKQPQISRLEAFDLAPNLIKEAQQRAQKGGYAHLHFFTADVYDYQPAPESYDVLLFHSSLHHFSDPGGLLSTYQSCLKPGGYLILNEYVGPNRLQFPAHQVRAMQAMLESIPEAFRERASGGMKKSVFAPGSLRMILNDPSEAVQSADILPAVHQLFNLRHEAGYGGNLLHLVLKDIAHNFLEESTVSREVLQDLFQQEDAYLKAHPGSDFVFGVYQKPD
ncbi:MAG: class I SAM-dependent methyltransferase [Bacteroidota bacterium]